MGFMIRYTSGPHLPSHFSRAWLLNLSFYPQDGVLRKTARSTGLAYTVSIDATHADMTTGISAHDRALTCRTLIFAALDELPLFRRPEHVVPPPFKQGDKEARWREAGHYGEATIEFCRLAGKRPAGAISAFDRGRRRKLLAKSERKEAGMMTRDGCLRFW